MAWQSQLANYELREIGFEPRWDQSKVRPWRADTYDEMLVLLVDFNPYGPTVCWTPSTGSTGSRVYRYSDSQGIETGAGDRTSAL